MIASARTPRYRRATADDRGSEGPADAFLPPVVHQRVDGDEQEFEVHVTPPSGRGLLGWRRSKGNDRKKTRPSALVGEGHCRSDAASQVISSSSKRNTAQRGARAANASGSASLSFGNPYT